MTPSEPRAIGQLDQAPVEVSITTASVPRRSRVPVDALLALAGGGYALEVVEGAAHHLEAVKLGLFDDAEGLVEVSGGTCTRASAWWCPRHERASVLELRQVSKAYGAEPPVLALRDVSFVVARASCVRSSVRRDRARRRCCT